MSSERFYQCTNDAIERFSRYDRDLDIVTSWESLSRPYRDYFPDFKFDRFPSYYTGEDRWKNPNFTMTFDDRYGIAFKTYHRSSAAQHQDVFEQELEQLRLLGEDRKISNRDGEYVEPDNLDIALITGSGDSQTFGHKIEDEINSGSLDIEPNIIILEYEFVEEDISKYRFKRLTHPESNFRDDILPERGSLSHRLSTQGNHFENILVDIDEDYTELKATGMFTNRKPSDLYLACRLWDTILKDQLTDDEWDKWATEDPNKSVEKVVSCADIAKEIGSKYAPGANFTAEDVREALRFISIAKRAEQVSDDEFRVQYSNLKEKRREHKDANTDRSEIGDLAYLLSSWYCETTIDNSPKEIAEIISTDSYNKADLSGITGNSGLDI